MLAHVVAEVLPVRVLVVTDTVINLSIKPSLAVAIHAALLLEIHHELARWVHTVAHTGQTNTRAQTCRRERTLGIVLTPLAVLLAGLGVLLLHVPAFIMHTPIGLCMRQHVVVFSQHILQSRFIPGEHRTRNTMHAAARATARHHVTSGTPASM